MGQWRGGIRSACYCLCLCSLSMRGSSISAAFKWRGEGGGVDCLP